MNDQRKPWIGLGIAVVAMAASAHAQTLTITNGLTLWLNASAITGLSNGQAVSVWNDSSTNGYNATQSDPAKKPTYVTGVQNGKPVVRFTGDHISPANSDNLVTPSIAALPSLSLFLVAKPFDGLTDYVLTFGDNSHALLYGFLPDPSKWAFYDGTFHALMPLDFTKFQIVSYTAGSSGTGSWYIGSDLLSTAPFSGDIAEVLVYNRSLNATERQDVVEYLTAAWAIPEPSTVALLAVGGTLVLCRRWP